MKLLYTEIGPLGTPYKKGDWKLFAVHSETEIKGFFGEYQFLSNFWQVPIELDGVIYKSVELAYQAAKWDPENRELFLQVKELDSIDYNRKNESDKCKSGAWDNERITYMRYFLNQKFCTNNIDLHNLLQSTKGKNLEEMNWWGDIFWGTNKEGVGQNMLGKLLMEIRDSVI